MDRLPQSALTSRIIACAFEVHSDLGSGFLERVYENAMVIALREAGLNVQQQIAIPVSFRGQTVGDYYADLQVEGLVICELKAKDRISKAEEAQLVNYLVATGLDTGLLINFGTSVDIRRKFREYKKPANKPPVNPEKSR